MEGLKKILIVDDSEIDRGVLRSILNSEFEVVEADNGYSALDAILKKEEHFDAVLLDVSMPLLDGISVLRILRENHLQDVQIFMITVEATRKNIERALQYNIAEFIKKPFDRDEVLKRVRAKLNQEERIHLRKADIDETKKYISDLKFMYDRYLNLSGKSKKRDERRAYFMRVLLEKGFERKKKTELDEFQVEMLCKSAYLCNIGNMLLQNIPSNAKVKDKNRGNYLYQQHTIMGADILRLNSSKYCSRFVELCADVCLHHHERFDGKGFPDGIRGERISVYAQICGLLENFEESFLNSNGHGAAQFDHAISQLKKDSGLVSGEVFSLLEESRDEIVGYYRKNGI